MTKVMAHIEMMRPYTMFHSGLVAIAGAEVASAGRVVPWRVVLAALVTMCGWEAGLYAGDYYDRELDAHSKPSRPVPSGRVSPREALLTMGGLILVGYLAALALGVANLALAVGTTVLGIAYSKTFKAKAILGNFDRGVLGVCAVLFGGLAGGAILRPAVVLLAAMVFFHDAATNLVGAIRDIEGDRAAGYPTVPVVYGLVRAVWIVTALVLCWEVAGSVLMALPRPTPLALGLYIVALGIAAWVYVPLWLARRSVSRQQALAAHKYLIAERLVLLSAFIAVSVPAGVVIGLLAGSLAVSLGAQVVLRDRYERQAAQPQLEAPSPETPQPERGYA
ncbi:MAG: UbiA family prenyltransferase [Ktedonobacterales bacterium]|nr:UbiA family prenyltransferase [Ktedonobacterales bacterium]